MNGIAKALLIIVLGIAIVVAAPFVTIWSVNVLFHAGWTPDWTHWAALAWLEMGVTGLFARAGKKA